MSVPREKAYERTGQAENKLNRLVTLKDSKLSHPVQLEPPVLNKLHQIQGVARNYKVFNLLFFLVVIHLTYTFIPLKIVTHFLDTGVLPVSAKIIIKF